MNGLKKKLKKTIIKFNRDENYNLRKAEIENSAKILENIYNNKEDQDRLAGSGYKTWLEKFTWGVITKKYLELYTNLLKK